MFTPPRLGVGLIYSPVLEPLLQHRPDMADVLEIEPQTHWLAQSTLAGPYAPYEPALAAIAAHCQHKLVHSVGMPLAGTRPPSPAQMALVAQTARRLGAPWVSEHLSVGGTPHQAAGFLLPPLQTALGVATAVANIRAFAKGIGLPVAVETGVSYLRRKPFEMADGDFVAAVAAEADCGILLDIHNIWCNEKNGRCSVDDFVSRLPLDRVWEVHLAGGAEMDGFMLDAHSGPMSAEMADCARRILRALPNLGAVNFEIYGSFAELMDDAGILDIMDGVRGLWSEAGRACGDGIFRAGDGHLPPAGPEPDAWENALTAAVWKGNTAGHCDEADSAALHLYGKLAASFRGSLLVRALPRTLRFLFIRDPDGVEPLLAGYLKTAGPQLFGPLEAKAFCEWLAQSFAGDGWLLALAAYDLALLGMPLNGEGRTVVFPGDPQPLFEALAEGRLPEFPDPPEWEIEILPHPGFAPAQFPAGPS